MLAKLKVVDVDVVVLIILFYFNPILGIKVDRMRGAERAGRDGVGGL